PRGRAGRAPAARPFPGRPRAGPPPGLPGGPRDAPPRAAGTVLDMSGERARIHSARAEVRAFVALEFEDAMRRRIAAAREALGRESGGVRWLAPDPVPLPLRSLGSATREALDRLAAGVAQAARACPPCEARVRGIGFFPPHGPPHVIW